MKKFSLSLILIFLAYFFTINSAYCEEDFFIDSNFTEAKNKYEFPNEKVNKVTQEVKKKGLFKKKKTR